MNVSQERIKQIEKMFFTNKSADFCGQCFELEDCAELLKKYLADLAVSHRGRGCSPCRKKALMKKYAAIISSKLL